MAKFRYQHIKSSVEGKAPSAAQIKVAEIGVNDFASDEKLFIKNSEGEVVDFPRGYSRQYIDNNERVIAEALNNLNSRKLDASAYTPTDLSNYYTKDETSASTEIADALDEKANLSDIPSVTPYADSVKFNSTTKYVEFYHGTTAGTKVFEYDASPFLIDGMVESVEVVTVDDVKYLRITWNSAAGSQVTDIPLTDIFDPSLYYTKTETSGATELTTAFGNKADTATTLAGYGITDAYTKTETSGKTEIQDALADKADTATTIAGYGITDAYTKSETSGATELSTEFALYVKEADIDQTINSTTSASTGAVSTSAVYNFVTSYTPSITVDQVIDDTTSASTNPVSTKAVYSAMTENELVWANAYVTLSGEIKTHVEDTNVHLTTSEKNGLGKASGITSMDGYQIASTAAAIDPLVDTLLTAIAKLEKRIYDLEHPNP